MTGAEQGPDPGTGTRGSGGLEWGDLEVKGGARGLPIPGSARVRKSGVMQLQLEGSTQWEITWTPGPLLKGPDLFKERAGLGRGHGQPQPCGQSSVPSHSQWGCPS